MGLSKLDRLLMKVAFLIPAYIFVSAMVIGITALCLRLIAISNIKKINPIKDNE